MVIYCCLMGLYSDLMDYEPIHVILKQQIPSGYVKIAIEHGPGEIVDLPS